MLRKRWVMSALMLWGGLFAVMSVLLFVAQNIGRATNGDVLAFASDREGHRDIFLLDLVRNITLNVTDDLSADDSPAWSSDGRLAFESRREDRSSAIMVMDALTFRSEQIASGSGNYTPTWSPNGELTYVTSYRNNLDIVMFDFVSGESRSLIDSPANDTNPAWSPDGRLAFDSSRGGAFLGRIFVVNPNTRTQRTIPNSARFYDPTWSPNGRLTVVSNLDGNYDILLLNPITGEASAVVNSSANERYPAWSATGWLAYVVEQGNSSEIYVLNIDTGETRGVTHSGVNDYAPAWMP